MDHKGTDGVMNDRDYDRLTIRALNLGILTAESLCDSVNNPPRPAAVYPAPALHKWWAELRAGTRTVKKFDTLWRAACAEQSGLDAQRDGMDAAASRDFARAADILREAAA